MTQPIVNVVIRPQGPVVIAKTKGVRITSADEKHKHKRLSMPWHEARAAILEAYKAAPPEAQLAAARVIRRFDGRFNQRKPHPLTPPGAKLEKEKAAEDKDAEVADKKSEKK